MKNTTMVDKRSSKKMIMVNEEKQRVEKLKEDDNGEKKNSKIDLRTLRKIRSA